MPAVEVVFPEGVRDFLRSAIRAAGENEVFFLGRVAWSRNGTGPVATLVEVDLLARGNVSSVPAITHRADGWHVAIHNHPSGRLEPSEADLQIAGDLGSRNIGFAIISNDAERQYIVIPPFASTESPVLVDPAEVREIFRPGGPLATALGGYEPRDGQVAMALEVARALNEDSIVALEAGTGVGKSLGYLVPVILWATRNRQKVAVSTGTIHLQEQLVGKDLPLLEKALPVPFQFALVKGRGNYACLRKLEEAKSDLKQGSTVADDQVRQLTSLVEWAEGSRDGSRSELGWIPRSEVWEQVMSETDKSLKARCKHYSECFFYAAKRRAACADVLVVNHHLLFADLSVRQESDNYTDNLVIPAYRRVVFDEAHHLEDVASEYFGLRFSQVGIAARINRLLWTKDHSRGVIPALVKRVGAMGDRLAGDRLQKAYCGTIIEVRERVEDLFFELEQTALEAQSTAKPRFEGKPSADVPLVHDLPSATAPAQESLDATPSGDGGFQIRYRGSGELDELWSAVTDKLGEIEGELARLLAVNDQALQIIKRSKLTEDQVESQSLELKSFGSRLSGLIADIQRFRQLDEQGSVRWLGLRPGRWRREEVTLEFASAPIRVGEAMKTALYDQLRTVVMTSATLSVAGKAEFFADRLGLSLVSDGRFKFSEYASPFDFKTQAITAVPTDFPLPESRDFARSVPEAVYEIVRASRGRAFVLFTSYSLLRKTYEAIASRLRTLGLKPVAQGEAPRSELLGRFRTGVANVLFGTDSFWEGVDVKGSALECVILTRLPFRVPTEPVQEARMEELEARGENAFTSFTVPQAVLRFKQGFGRLIRSQTDRGVVVVLDRRLLTKPYGRTFFASLPETRIVKGPLAEIRKIVGDFFAHPQPTCPEGSAFLAVDARQDGPPW